MYFPILPNSDNSVSKHIWDKACLIFKKRNLYLIAYSDSLKYKVKVTYHLLKWRSADHQDFSLCLLNSMSDEELEELAFKFYLLSLLTS